MYVCFICSNKQSSIQNLKTYRIIQWGQLRKFRFEKKIIKILSIILLTFDRCWITYFWFYCIQFPSLLYQMSKTNFRSKLRKRKFLVNRQKSNVMYYVNNNNNNIMKEPQKVFGSQFYLKWNSLFILLSKGEQLMIIYSWHWNLI